MTSDPQDSSNPDEALRQLDAVLQQMERAAVLLAEGRSFEALRLAEKAAQKLPNTPGMHYLRAVCFNAMERYEEALEAAQTELGINPSHKETQELIRDLGAKLRARSKPVGRAIATSERPWNTELARESLLSIQDAIGRYSYRGVRMVKNPFDFALYPLLLWNLKPGSIIEIGSSAGGSAYWLGDLLDTYRLDSHIYSIDIIKVTDVVHPRVTFLEGDGRNLSGALSGSFLSNLKRPLLVIEDADHAYETSIHVLNFFHPILKLGEYIVVEDGINSDLYCDSPGTSGPHRALKEFLNQHPTDYEIDSYYCDFFGYNFTWCTNGFLKKVAFE